MTRCFSCRAATAAFWLAAVGSTVGCEAKFADRPKLHPVTGVVKQAGKPVAGAQVAFHNGKSPRLAAGVTDADGRYRLTTFARDDGAIEGEA
ncbi:MAG: hypothetical protein ACRC1K_22790, partial [Planctomycetia bacterium]